MSNPFANWSQSDVELFNARSRKVPIHFADVTGQEHEKDLHNQIFNECRRRGWIAFHGSMAERSHRTLGEPDFIILQPVGNLLMVECKTRTGKLTIEQQAMIAHAAKLGHKIHVVRSLAEFLNLL